MNSISNLREGFVIVLNSYINSSHLIISRHEIHKVHIALYTRGTDNRETERLFIISLSTFSIYRNQDL